MPKKPRARGASTGDTATKVAENIGEALAHVVNRLESLDAERDKAYAQLLALQERLNAQVARFGHTVGSRVTAASADGRRIASRLKRKAKRAVVKRRIKKRGPKRAAKKASKKTAPATRARKKSRVTCSICGTSGHNARGHAKWQAARNK